jgi:NAD(P)-dependent dehydrogenase (short-subunit alcohol dehydrogenase family)
MARAIADQVVVITGASSGIGRATALEFGRRGAVVVLAARGVEPLNTLAEEITRAGGRALVVPTDVSDWDAVQGLAAAAKSHFGRIDTWVNNAAVGEYATVEQTSVEEIERIIQVNLLGQIYGMKAALPVLKESGGALINVASVEAERALPYHAPYSASKHGVKGFTEALRVELARERSPVRVTLILPGSINTPFFNHARSKLGVKPLPLPPIYGPASVAAAIVFAAERPQRVIYVGSSSRTLAMLERLSPALVDRLFLLGGAGFRLQKTNQPDDGKDNLFAPMPERSETQGDFGRLAKPISLYTRLFELHPERKRIAMAGAVAGAVLLLRRPGH